MVEYIVLIVLCGMEKHNYVMAHIIGNIMMEVAK